MNTSKVALWINCIVLGLWALAVSPASAEIAVNLVNAIANFFSADCIYFLRKSSKIGLVEEKLAKGLSSGFGPSFGFSNFSAYHSTLKKSGKQQCQVALRVILQLNKVEGLNEFNEFYADHAEKVRSGVWLVFTESFDENSASELLREIHLPLDTEIIIAWTHNDVVHLKEVYQVAPSHPVRQSYFGNWSLSAGFNTSRPHSGLFKNTNLEGLELKVGYIEENMPFTAMRSSATGFVLEGYFGEIWSALENFLNLSSAFVKVDLNRVEEDGNSWLNIMKMIKDKKIDAGLADFVPTNARTEYFDFSHPLLTSDFQVFYQNIPSNHHSKSYLHPFGNDIWLVLLVWAVMNSVCISCTTFLRKRFIRKKGKVITAQTSFFMTFTGLCAQGSPSIPKFSSCRVLFLCTYMVAAIVIPSYSSSLTRHLTAKPSGVTFQNLVDIYEKGLHRFITVGGSYEYFIFKSNTGEDIWKKIYDQYMRNEKLPKSYGEALLLTCKHKDTAFFTVTTSLIWELNKKENGNFIEECRLKKMSQNAGKSMNSIIFPKNSRFRKLIDYHLKILHSTGVIHRLQQKYWPNRLGSRNKTWESETLWNSSALFRIFFSGGILSVFVFILEKTFNNVILRTKK